MAAVGLIYAPLAPLVALAAAVVFWISSIVYKYQLMFVFVSKVESGGVSELYQGFKAASDRFLSASGTLSATVYLPASFSCN
jgi:hypothetical protein